MNTTEFQAESNRGLPLETTPAPHAGKPGAINRREFLTRGGGAVLAGAALAAGVRAAETRWAPRFSTSSIHFKDLSLEKACEQIAALGYQAIDIWSGYDGCPHLDDALKRLGPEGLQQALEKSRLKLYAFSVYVGGYQRYAELLGKAGGGVAIQGSAGPCPPAELTAKMRTFLEGLKPLADLAEQHNSWLAIENHGQSLLDSQDSFKAFVDLNRSPRLGIALAPYHVQSTKAPVEEVIRICGRQLFFFYAWQNQPEVNQLPGQGTTDFTPWMKALADINYRWYVNPFMHGHIPTERMSAALAKSLAYLKKMS
jgi:sugar phosphate isomerase/epimerase